MFSHFHIYPPGPFHPVPYPDADRRKTFDDDDNKYGDFPDTPDYRAVPTGQPRSIAPATRRPLFPRGPKIPITLPPSVLAFLSPSAFPPAEREPTNQTPGIAGYVKLCVILLPPDAPKIPSGVPQRSNTELGIAF